MCRPQAGKWAALLLIAGCARTPPPQCGVASLVAILARVGRPVAYPALLRKTHVVDGHTTFADLALAARACGLTMRGYRLTSPTLLKTDDVGVVELTADHFVALVGRHGDAYEIVDSPDGESHEPVPWSAARLESEWTGSVLLVERSFSSPLWEIGVGGEEAGKTASGRKE